MKKTLFALFALAGILSAAEDSYTLKLNWSDPDGNYNLTTYGLKLSFSSDKLTNPEIPMTENVILQNMSLLGSFQNGTQYEKEFAILVLDQASNVLGYSDIQKRVNGSVGGVTNYVTFNFKAVNQSPLTLSSTSVYDYIWVTPDTIDALSGGSNYTYQISTDDVTVTGNTITGGCLGVNLRCWDQNAADDCVVYSDASKALSANAPFIRSIGLQNIPEPATATLSLMALCGLAARRRRK